MSDLIERRAAIEALGYGNEWEVLGITVIDKDDAERQIMALPSAQPVTAVQNIIKEIERLKDKCGYDEILIVPKTGVKAWDESGAEYSIQPSAQPQTGRWIEPSREGCLTFDYKAFRECSVCGKKQFLADKMNYCPNCGAKMEVENETD